MHAFELQEDVVAIGEIFEAIEQVAKDELSRRIDDQWFNPFRVG